MIPIHAIVPAAGGGTRFGGPLPKQYLPLLGRPLLLHTLEVLCGSSRIHAVWLVLSPEDERWALPEAFDARKLRVLRCGGATRAQTVGNAIQHLLNEGVEPSAWTLVHDAARPCLSEVALSRLISSLEDDPVGGILAVPLADTLKQGDATGRVVATLPRERLWQAQTPQMFRLGLLSAALTHFSNMTDEAGAVEAAGHRPRLVQGELSNLKVTYPDDLALAAAILQAREDMKGSV